MDISSSHIHMCGIFNLPDEILREIILNLNARERVALAGASKRFHHLVFGDKLMLRNLDFSEEGRLTTLFDINQYFKNKKTRKYIVRVNLCNVTCVTRVHMLKNTLGRAKNLIEINIHGIKLSIQGLASFLEALLHLERLSIDWPKTNENDVLFCRSALQISFARLRYLSVRIRRSENLPEFIVSLHLCEKLEELRIAQFSNSFYNYGYTWPVERKGLKNLKIVEYCGDVSVLMIQNICYLFTNPRDWCNFIIAPDAPFKGLYFEKNIEICEALAEPEFHFCHYASSNRLLKQIIIETCECEQDDFCCLSHGDKLPCVMKIEEMKMLLKNPSHKISFLKITHSIESRCSVHLLASIFPTLTELVLTNIIKKQPLYPINTHSKTRLRRIGEPDSDDLWNTNRDTCFQMLIKNTPLLRHLTLNAGVTLLKVYEEWDLEALHLIAGWKNLRTLCLKFIPVTDGEFLIEIGKQCVLLEKLELVNLGHWDGSDLERGLQQMLRDCQNLRDVTIFLTNMHAVSKLLLSLDNNRGLRRVSIRCRSRADSTETLVSSIKHLLKQCPRLNTLLCVVDPTRKLKMADLTLALKRLRVELNRPTWQFQVVDHINAEDKILEDYLPPSFPWDLDRLQTRQ